MKMTYNFARQMTLICKSWCSIEITLFQRVTYFCTYDQTTSKNKTCKQKETTLY